MKNRGGDVGLMVRMMKLDQKVEVRAAGEVIVLRLSFLAALTASTHHSLRAFLNQQLYLGEMVNCQASKVKFY